MSQWHAREGDQDGNTFTIIYHIPIPAANNRAGVSYQAALVGSGIGGKTVMTEGTGTGQISTAEKASVLAGSVYEWVEQVTTNPGETIATIQAKLNARYTALADVNGTFLQQLKNRLQYWGGASAS